WHDGLLDEHMRQMSHRTLTFLLGVGCILALALLTVAVFRGCLHGPFHFDDRLFLENTNVTEPGSLAALLRPTQIRPLTYVTFYVNYRIGGASARGFHAVNLALHLVNVALVFALVWSVARHSRRIDSGGAPVALSFGAAALFAVHPIQSESVNYVYQRSTLLGATFSLLAFLAFL